MLLDLGLEVCAQSLSADNRWQSDLWWFHPLSTACLRLCEGGDLDYRLAYASTNACLKERSDATKHNPLPETHHWISIQGWLMASLTTVETHSDGKRMEGCGRRDAARALFDKLSCGFPAPRVTRRPRARAALSFSAVVALLLFGGFSSVVASQSTAFTVPTSATPTWRRPWARCRPPYWSPEWWSIWI